MTASGRARRASRSRSFGRRPRPVRRARVRGRAARRAERPARPGPSAEPRACRDRRAPPSRGRCPAASGPRRGAVPRTPRRRAACPRPRRGSGAGGRPARRRHRAIRRAVRLPGRRFRAARGGSTLAFGRPAAQLGRSSSSSGRAVATTSSGASVAKSTAYSMRSSRVGLGPMEILDHDQEGPPTGDGFEQPADGPEQLLLGGGLGRQADGAADPDGEDIGVAFAREQALDLRSRGVGPVALVDPSGSVDDLADRPVGDPVAVAQAVPDEDCGIPRAIGQEFGHQAALADARRGNEGEKGRPPFGARRRPGPLQCQELEIAPDERRVRPATAADHARITASRRPRLDRSALALDLEGDRRPELDRVADEGDGRLPEEDVSDRGGSLQPRGDVDRIAGHERPALGRLAGDDLAGIDPDADREVARVAADRVTQLGRRADGPQGVVLVHDRHPEDGHDRIADELLDRPAVGLDDGAGELEVARHPGAHDLGIQPLAELGRADHIGEQDRDDLAHLVTAAGDRQRCAACGAESSPLGVVGRARRTEAGARASIRGATWSGRRCMPADLQRRVCPSNPSMAATCSGGRATGRPVA